MDLKERHAHNTRRHPWETARLKALQKIVAPELREGISVLDVGCGDGFIASNLFRQLRDKRITAVDTQLTDDLIAELSDMTPDATYLREIPRGVTYDFVLLLDVLEHVADDRAFLAGIVADRCSAHSRVMITVPAFQTLYGTHDAFLGHYRRYHLDALTELAESSGLRIIESGYLFLSLLVPKLVLFKLLKCGNDRDGVGNWQGGRGVTTLVERMLDIDNSMLLCARRFGITLPGLTGWALCAKRES